MLNLKGKYAIYNGLKATVLEENQSHVLLQTYSWHDDKPDYQTSIPKDKPTYFGEDQKDLYTEACRCVATNIGKNRGGF